MTYKKKIMILKIVAKIIVSFALMIFFVSQFFRMTVVPFVTLVITLGSISISIYLISSIQKDKQKLNEYIKRQRKCLYKARRNMREIK